MAETVTPFSEMPWSRREVLRMLAGIAGVPVFKPADGPRRRVGVVGGGMAGVATAWLLDGKRDIVLLEAAPTLGGNVQSIPVEIDGQSFVVDMGAQYFHPKLYPTYVKLLEFLGLSSHIHSFTASITLEVPTEPTPRFVSPILPDRTWPLIAQWNWPGIQAFGISFADAKKREEENADWDVTMESWLQSLHISRPQWEGMVLPWAASLYSGNLEQTRGLSARAAMIFAAKALPDNITAPILYYVLKPGMAEVLRRMIARSSTIEVLTGTCVTLLTRNPQGGFDIQANGRTLRVDDLVMASSGPASLELLRNLPDTSAQQLALQGMEFQPARLALHMDSIYAPLRPIHWSFFNAQIQGTYCESSMWLAEVIAEAPPKTAAKLWKSWITHRSRQPAQVLAEAQFLHMLPTPGTLHAQTDLHSLQGKGGLWFAGGYTRPYDSQETALVSAIEVAQKLLALSV